MKKIAIWDLKGGIGKTTTAINFGYNLSVLGKRVLLVDMDPQGNLSSMLRRYDITKEMVLQAMQGRKPKIKRTRIPNLHILASDIRLMELFKMNLEATALRDALESADNYDYCIFDCPPAADACTEQAVTAADEIIIPVTATRWGKDGLSMVTEIIRDINPDAEIAGILFTMFKRNRLTLGHIRDIMVEYDCPVFENAISKTEDIVMAENRKKPVGLCRSHSVAAEDYRAFTLEYLKKEEARCRS